MYGTVWGSPGWSNVHELYMPRMPCHMQGFTKHMPRICHVENTKTRQNAPLPAALHAFAHALHAFMLAATTTRLQNNLLSLGWGPPTKQVDMCYWIWLMSIV